MSAKHLSPEVLNKRRMEAVRLRLDGLTVAETTHRTGLSAPTISAAWKAFREGGWGAVPVSARGRHKGTAQKLGEQERACLWQRLFTWPSHGDPGWTSRHLSEVLGIDIEQKVSPRAIEHWLEAQDLKPLPMVLEPKAWRSREGRWLRQSVAPVLKRVQRLGGTHWQGGVRVVSRTDNSQVRSYQLYVHGKRDVLHTRCFAAPPQASDYLALFERLAGHDSTALIFHGAYCQASADIANWLRQHPDFNLLDVPPNSNLAATS